MLQNLEIRNFRLFDHLKMERLGQINLVGGRNNSGKTTLLEALFLLCGTANPELVLRINTFRGFRGLNELVTPTAIPETILKPLFYQFDSNKTIKINGQYDSLDYIELKVTVERQNTVALSLKNRQTDTSAVDQRDPIQIPSSTLVGHHEKRQDKESRRESSYRNR